MIALLGRLADQLIENQFAMLLECAQALFKRKEQRLRQLWGLARVKCVLKRLHAGERSGPSIRRCARWLGQDASVPERNSWICTQPSRSASLGAGRLVS